MRRKLHERRTDFSAKEIIKNFSPIAVDSDVDSDGMGASVLVKDKNSNFSAWVDVWCNNEYNEPDMDWNQYIFHKNNSNDRKQEEIQNNADVADLAFSAALDYVEDNNLLKNYRNESFRKSKKVRRKLKEDVNDNEPKVFMNTWTNYNEYGADSGITPTGWMTIPEAVEYMDKYAEHEPFINDTDNFPFEIDENDTGTLRKLAEIMNDPEIDFDMVVRVIDAGHDLQEAIDIVEDGRYIFYPLDLQTDSELAYAVLDEMGGVESLDKDTLENYFDYDAYGRDLGFDFTFVDDGAIQIY